MFIQWLWQIDNEQWSLKTRIIIVIWLLYNFRCLNNKWATPGPETLLGNNYSRGNDSGFKSRSLTFENFVERSPLSTLAHSLIFKFINNQHICWGQRLIIADTINSPFSRLQFIIFLLEINQWIEITVNWEVATQKVILTFECVWKSLWICTDPVVISPESFQTLISKRAST